MDIVMTLGNRDTSFDLIKLIYILIEFEVKPNPK